MLNRIYIINKFKKGSTLIELVISMTLLGILMAPLPGLLNMNIQNSKQSDKIDYSDLHLLISDLNFDSALASSESYVTNVLTINRIDNCAVNYTYSPTAFTIKKSLTCSGVTPKERLTKIYNIQSFTFTTNAYNNIVVNIKKKNETITHSYVIRQN